MKAVMFDFDGTITHKCGNIWKEIWNNLGYETGKGSDFSLYFIMFLTKDITHQEWCDLTCEKFMNKNLHNRLIKRLTKNIKLMDGAVETFKELKAQGYSLNIISGNFKSVIKDVLGDNIKYFDNIEGNEFVFDNNGFVKGIIGTKYDFEGKAQFITDFVEKTKIPADQIYFIGNGDNDEWAHKSGCKTICLNAVNTNHEDRTIWHQSINDVNDLRNILPLINETSEKDNSNE